VMIPVWIVLPAITINVFMSMIEYKYWSYVNFGICPASRSVSGSRSLPMTGSWYVKNVGEHSVL
jgi:hypothetical protein